MKARTLVAAVAAALSLGATLPAFAAESHAHGHAESAMRLSLDDGRKWATDGVLRQGMGEIRTALEARRGELRRQSLKPDERRALGEAVEAKVGFIISNCKLTEKADANLHVVLGEVLGGADTVRNGTPAEAALGAERIAGALDAYGKHFEHPGWAPLKVAFVRPLTLTESVELIGRTYPGRVISAQSDVAGGDALHYHVDLMLPNGNVAKFEVDARSQRIANRMPPEESPAGVVSLADAMKKVQAETRGRVLAAEYDPDPRPHYHVSVRGPKGEVTRLDFDVQTGKSAPHQPRS